MNPFRFNVLFAGVLMALSALSVNAAHQAISPAGLYFGKAGASDVFVSIGRADAAAIYIADQTLGYVEFAGGAPVPGGVATWASNRGRIFTLSVGSDSVSGTIAGQPFTALPEPPVGPFGRRAFGYIGTGFVPELEMTQPILFSVTATGKALFVMLFADFPQGGVGTISEAGVVNIPLANGVPLTFLFSPTDGLATGAITSPGFYNTNFLLVQSQRPPLVNISTLGSVGGGHNMSAGFVTELAGKTFLIRAVGPRLLDFGVGNAHPNPTLTLYQNGIPITSNDDWGTNGDPALIEAAADQVGAFPLNPGSKDAVMLVTLEPGAYAAQVTADGDVGAAMVEVYEVR